MPEKLKGSRETNAQKTKGRDKGRESRPTEA